MDLDLDTQFEIQQVKIRIEKFMAALDSFFFVEMILDLDLTDTRNRVLAEVSACRQHIKLLESGNCPPFPEQDERVAQLQRKAADPTSILDDGDGEEDNPCGTPFCALGVIMGLGVVRDPSLDDEDEDEEEEEELDYTLHPYLFRINLSPLTDNTAKWANYDEENDP